MEFSNGVLEHLNFGPSFIKWVQTLYDDPISYVKNNGYISRTISIQRGIRQGCPLSALLFIITTEVMASKIREDNDIVGLTVPDINKSVKILQYADDAVLCMNNEREVKKCIDIINEFGMISGMQLNLSKCEGLWIGNLKHRQINCTLFDIKWPIEPLRCLGIYIGYDDVMKKTLNWDTKVESIRNLLNSWKQRDLTLFGKVVIIKQLAIPKILYSASMLHVPEGITSELNSLFYDFIWGKVDRVKRNVIISDYNQGGLKMIDVETLFHSVKASWVVRLINARDDDIWSIVAKYYFSYKDDLLFKLNCTKSSSLAILKNVSMFYKSMYESYMKSKCTTYDFFCDSILDQPIWGNDLVKCKGLQGRDVTLFFKSWIDCNLFKIGNLKFVNGCLDCQYIFQKVTNQCNIFSEISMMKSALRPFKHILLNHEPEQNTDIPMFQNPSLIIDDLANIKSKFFYDCILRERMGRPVAQERYWQGVVHSDEINFNTIYVSNFCHIKDKKLAEFKFKVIHGILPCNVNLHKWKIRNTKACSVCGHDENIEHLLYNCKYAAKIWDDFTMYTGVVIDLCDVIFTSTGDNDRNFIICLVAYLIYKEWLIKSLDNDTRDNVPSLKKFKSDLEYRQKIYDHLQLKGICRLISKLI